MFNQYTHKMKTKEVVKAEKVRVGNLTRDKEKVINTITNMLALTVNPVEPVYDLGYRVLDRDKMLYISSWAEDKLREIIKAGPGWICMSDKIIPSVEEEEAVKGLADSTYKFVCIF